MSVLAVLGYTFACTGVGSVLLWLLARRLGTVEHLGFVPRMGTVFLLGQGGLAIVWQSLALAGVFYPWILLVCVAAAALLGLLFAPGMGRQFHRWARARINELRSMPLMLAMLMFATAVLAAGYALATILPPSGSDPLAYYMAMPKYLIHNHGILPLMPLVPMHLSYYQWGISGEFHFAALMALRGPIAAKMFVFPTMLAGLCMLVALGGAVGLRLSGKVLLLAVVFTSSTVTNLISDGKVDLFGAAFALAAYYWVSSVRPDEQWQQNVRLAGVFIGLAVVAKLSYATALVPAMLVLLALRLKPGREPAGTGRFPWAFCARTMVYLGVFALLAYLPQMVKNAILFGHPFAPFFPSPGSIMIQSWYSIGTAVKIFITYPLAITFGIYAGQYGNYSPLFVAFLPLLMLLPRPKFLWQSPMIQVTCAAVVGEVGFAVSSPGTFTALRYHLASLLVLSVPVVYAAEQVFHNELRPRYITAAAGICLAIVILGTIGTDRVKFGNAIQYFRGKLPEGEVAHYSYLPETLANRTAQPGDRILLACWSRYYLDSALVKSSVSYTELATVAALPSAERWSWLYDHHVRLVIVDGYTHATLAANGSLQEVRIPLFGTTISFAGWLTLPVAQLPAGIKLTPIYTADKSWEFKLELSDDAAAGVAPVAPIIQAGQIPPTSSGDTR